MVVLTVLFGLFIFVFAGAIVSRLDESVLSEDRKMTDMSSTLEIQEEKVQAVRWESLDASGYSENENANKRQIERLIAKLEMALKVNDGFQEKIAQMRASEERVRKNGTVDINAVSVRLAITLLIVFLVQILTRSYQQNTALSVFYDSRGDMLELAVTLGSQPQEFVGLVYPADLELDKAAKSPIQEALGAVNGISAALSKKGQAVVGEGEPK